MRGTDKTRQSQRSPVEKQNRVPRDGKGHAEATLVAGSTRRAPTSGSIHRFNNGDLDDDTDEQEGNGRRRDSRDSHGPADDGIRRQEQGGNAIRQDGGHDG